MLCPMSRFDAAGRRFEELDAFRGIAALLIVLFHLISRYRQMIVGTGDPGPVIGYLEPLVATLIGGMPVSFFFMISGFVIVWTLEKCRTWQDFAISRFSRLYPTFWAAVTVTYLVGIVDPLPIQHYTPLQFLANLTMFHDELGIPAIDGAYWSLSVELIFYIGMGSLFALGWMRYLQIVCFVWALACLANVLLASVGIDVWYRVQKYALLWHGPFLIAGVMFFHGWKGQQSAFTFITLIICLFSILINKSFLVALIYFFFFVIFFLSIHGRLEGIVLRPLLWLGSISYALYVCHEFLGYRMMLSLENLGMPRLPATAAALGSVLLLAWTITNAIERPSLRFIRAAWSRRTPVRTA